MEVGGIYVAHWPRIYAYSFNSAVCLFGHSVDAPRNNPCERAPFGARRYKATAIHERSSERPRRVCETGRLGLTSPWAAR